MLVTDRTRAFLLCCLCGGLAVELLFSGRLVGYYRGGDDDDGRYRQRNGFGPPDRGEGNSDAEVLRSQILRAERYFGRTGFSSRVAPPTVATANSSEASNSGFALPEGSYRFPAADNPTSSNDGGGGGGGGGGNPPPWGGILLRRPLLFVTTHMSPPHAWHLKSCWPSAMLGSALLSRSDVMVYLTSSNRTTGTTGRIASVNLLRETFRHQNLTVHVRDNPGYQEGAMSAMAEAVAGGWFRNHDWVVRLNPDVILRNETFVRAVMEDDANASAVLIDCNPARPRNKVHTDFFAFRPAAMGPDAFANTSLEGGMTAEIHFANYVRDLVPRSARWILNSAPTWGCCRAGWNRSIHEADVYHLHVGDARNDKRDTFRRYADPDLTRFDNCPVPF